MTEENGQVQSNNSSPDETKPIVKSRLRQTLELVSFLAGALTIIGLILLSVRKDDPNAFITRAMLQTNINGLKLEIDTLNLNMDEIRFQIQDIGKNIPEQSVIALQLNALNQSVSENQKKLASLEEVILDNPQKVLALPLMKKDIESLKDNRQTDMAESKQAIDRIYDQSKWFIGLMITSAIGIIALAISNFFKR